MQGNAKRAKRQQRDRNSALRERVKEAATDVSGLAAQPGRVTKRNSVIAAFGGV